jgi:GTP-binding protein Era
MKDEPVEKQPFKSGFVSIVGRSNVGKSTLLNSLIGTKLAIITEKPQTTRQPIQGVYRDERGEIVFVDTPGLYLKTSDRLTKLLNQKAKESLEDVDVIAYVVDPTKQIGREEELFLSIMEKIKIPKILVVNKNDVYNPAHMEDYNHIQDRFDARVDISALQGTHLKSFINLIFTYLQEGEAIYPEFQITNVENKFWFAEIIREKIFHQLYSEVPYSINVKIEEMDRREDGMLYIRGIIETTDDRYKKMVIGKRGAKIKEIGTSARHDLERIIDGKVFLDLEVEVNPRWVESM